MDDLAATLADVALAFARLSGYADGDRRDALVERLSVNLPELEVLARMPSPPGRVDGYLTPPRQATDAGGGAGTGMGAVTGSGAVTGAGAARALAARSLAGTRDDLHAFTALATVDAIEVAARRTLRAGGATGSALAGTPIAVKDLMQVEGFVQTNGSRGMPAVAATRDATAVARLRDAGAIVIGVTNLHEYAYGITSDNPHFGPVVNPRAPGRLPGGSSGGSAAAVAAGIVPIAIGTDTAGSIRIPAACCGVVGFKPSFDAVPRDGVQSLSASLDHVGPLAASVADAARAFAVMSGAPMHPLHTATLAGVRLGVPRRHFFAPLDDHVAAGVALALERLRADGAELVDVDVDGIENAAAIQFVTLCCEAADTLNHLLATPSNLGVDVRIRLEIGRCFPAVWYVRAQRARAALAAAFDSALHGVEALVTPTLRVAPPPCGAREARAGDRTLPLHTAMTALTMPFNLCGMPALTVPVAQRMDGLPVGVQIAGRRGGDWRVLGLGARIAELVAS